MAEVLAVLAFGRLIGVIAGGVYGCFAVMGFCYAALAYLSHRHLLRWGLSARR